MTQTIDLTTIAPPDVVEELDFETIYQELLADFRRLYPEWTASLESDPVVKLLELAAYREMLLRARINDAAQSNLLAFAAGGDLDQLAAFYGVVRQNDELDDRLRLRVQFQIAALAGNGTSERYRAKAMEASDAVVDAAVLQPAAGSVDVALWISSGPSVDDVLSAVRAAFAADDARTLGVPLTVRQAQAKPISVAATIYREATAPIDLAQRLAANLPQALTDYAQLGRDVPRSWLLARLHVAGVSRIELSAPAGDVSMAPDEYATAGTMVITDGGVAW